MVYITGFGGISAAGRSSGHHAFRRIVYDALSLSKQQQTLEALHQVSGNTPSQLVNAKALLNHSLIRPWDNIAWNPNQVPFHQPFQQQSSQSPSKGGASVQCWRESYKRTNIRSAAQLPKGFDPGKLYPSHHHPRGLQMAIYGASDALGSLGMDWQQIQQHLAPDQVGVYASSAMGQLDGHGHGGMLQAAQMGKRTSSKQCPLGLAEMTADFINAYVLGNVGATGANIGACATFLYNLKSATDDIRSGKRRLVLVGCSEAPLIPEIIEGYNAMTALASEEKLRELDKLSADQAIDFTKASRPFGENTGFSLAESAQFFVLCDEALTLELGLSIHGAIGETFVHADGHKKSISGPGIGNYITMGKAMAEARRWLGEEKLTKGSFVQAHGSSTPQNRTTESEIFSTLAKTFNIEQWPITAVKAHLGHSLGTASADQLFTTLGSWAEGILPGITTTQSIAQDVQTEGLDFQLRHQEFESSGKPLAFLNSKGFGGNNASSFILSPQHCHQQLQQKLNKQQWHEYLDNNEQVRDSAKSYDSDTTAGNIAPRYIFGGNVLGPRDLDINDKRIKLKGWDKSLIL